MNHDYSNEALASTGTNSSGASLDEQFGPEKAPKGSKASRIILGVLLAIVAIILVVVIALGVTVGVALNKATAEVTLPEKTEPADMTKFAVTSVVTLIADDNIIVGNGEIQTLVDQVKSTVAASLEGTPVELIDLFCQLHDGQGTIYGQVYASEVEVYGFTVNLDKTITFSADFDINYEDPYIVAQIKGITCGDLSIPMGIVTTVASAITLPEGLLLEGDEIYYDVSGLDAMLDEALPGVLSEQLGENDLSSFLADLLVEKTDVKITGADIVGDQLIIEGEIF